MASSDNYYRFESSGGCSIITLLPELNDKQWADIEKVGSEIVDRLGGTQSPRFVIDLSPLSYMGSAMVALIVRLYKTANSRNGQMVVVNQHELVHEVLKLAGLTKLWTIVDSRDKGLAALGVKPGAIAKEGAATASGPAGNGILVAGVIGAVGAVICLALQFKGQSLVPTKIAQLLEFACAALGIISGTMFLVNQTGTKRNIGIVLLAISLLVVLGGILAAPDTSASPAKTPPPKTTSTPADTSPTPAAPAATPKTTPATPTPTKTTPGKAGSGTTGNSGTAGAGAMGPGLKRIK